MQTEAKSRPKPRPARSDPDEPGEEDREFVNLAGLAFVLALVIGGVLLVRALNHHNEIQTCIASGRRDCIDLSDPNASMR